MSWITLFGVAVGLAMDAFAVALTAGLILPKLSFRPVFRLAWHFGLFQFFMPVLGWLAGSAFQRYISAFDHWVAFGLLGIIGAKMIYESFQIKAIENRKDPTRRWSLVALSIATSIDALAVGLSMAALGINIWLPCVVIGITAGVLTVTGMLLGKRFGGHLGHRMELVGGFILLAIGIKILVQHVLPA